MNGWRGAMRWIGLAMCLVPILWMAISLLGAGEYLMSEVPAQWNEDQVTNMLPGWTVALTPIFGCLVSAVVSAAGAFTASERSLPLVYWLSAGFGCMFLAFWLGLYQLGTLGNGLPTPSPEAFIAAPFLILLGVIPWTIARLGRESTRERMHPRDDGAVAERELAQIHADSSVWTGRAASQILRVVAAGVAAIVITIASVEFAKEDTTAAVLTCIVGVVVFVLVIAFAYVYVAIDDSEVRIRSWLGVPAKRIAISRIRAVDACNVSIGEWGGLGYRKNARGTGFIIRSGLALELRTDEAAFFVTVDKADEAAAQLRRVLASRSEGA